jgi:hypothetical protein
MFLVGIIEIGSPSSLNGFINGFDRDSANGTPHDDPPGSKRILWGNPSQDNENACFCP